MDKAHHILKLPLEAREIILDYCSVTDLLEIGCCSSLSYDTVTPYLWHTVCIPWDGLECLSTYNAQKLENLCFTISLRFGSFGDHSCILLENLEGQDHQIKQLLESYVRVLESCNPERLQAMYFHWPFHFPSMIKLACNMFSISLRKLEFYDEYSKMGFWRDVGLISRLETLKIKDCFLTDKNLSDAIAGQRLVELSMQITSVLTERTFESISNLNTLRKLSLTDTSARWISSSAPFMKLALLSDLQSLCLICCSMVDETLVIILSNMKLLQHLNISGCKSLSNYSINMLSLSVGSSLKSLNLSELEITDSALCCATEMKTLHRLNLSNTGISNGALTHLKDMPSLKELDISSTSVSTDIIFPLANFRSLRYLDISYTKISFLPMSKFLEKLDKMRLKGLETLSDFQENVMLEQ